MADVAPPALPDLDRSGRDASRSPMHWDATPGGGFSTATPWLPLGDTASCNVADQRDDPGSLLALYRRLIRLRHESEAIGLGAQRQIDLPADLPAIAFWRSAGADRRLVVINVSPVELTIDLAAAGRGRLPARASLELSTASRQDADLSLAAVEVAPHEGLVARL